MVLTLQKLVHLHPDSNDSDSDMDETDSIGGTRKPRRGRVSKTLHKLFSKSKATANYEDKQRKASVVPRIHDPMNGFVTGHTDGMTGAPVQKLRTLQRYHGGVNQERVAYMEKNSPLTKRMLAVSAEQVSIFLTSGKIPPPLFFFA
jgi:hypothetical protein